MILKCPKCKTELPYGGYPSNPNCSTVMCMSCGYVGPGYAFHRICEICKKDFDIEEGTNIEKNGELSFMCNGCTDSVSPEISGLRAVEDRR